MASNNKTQHFIQQVNEKFKKENIDDLALRWEKENDIIYIHFKSGIKCPRKKVSAILFSSTNYLSYFGWYDAIDKTITDIKLFKFVKNVNNYLKCNNVDDYVTSYIMCEKKNKRKIIFKSNIVYYSDQLQRIIDSDYLKKYDWYDMYDSDTQGIKQTIKKEIKLNNSSMGGKICQEKIKSGEIVVNRKNNIPWNKGIKMTGYKNHRKGKTKEVCPHAKKSSERMKVNNPMFKLSREDKDILHSRQRKTFLETIKNGYTPKNNRLTRKNIRYNNTLYRSSWEICCHLLNVDYEYEKLRIKYTYLNKMRVYIVDFVSYADKHVMEVKPLSMFSDEKIIAKEKALIEWCKENGFKYSRFTEDDILLNYDKIMELCNDDEIKTKIKKVKRYEDN